MHEGKIRLPARARAGCAARSSSTYVATLIGGGDDDRRPLERARFALALARARAFQICAPSPLVLPLFARQFHDERLEDARARAKASLSVVAAAATFAHTRAGANVNDRFRRPSNAALHTHLHYRLLLPLSFALVRSAAPAAPPAAAVAATAAAVASFKTRTLALSCAADCNDDKRRPQRRRSRSLAAAVCRWRRRAVRQGAAAKMRALPQSRSRRAAQRPQKTVPLQVSARKRASFGHIGDRRSLHVSSLIIVYF